MSLGKKVLRDAKLKAKIARLEHEISLNPDDSRLRLGLNNALRASQAVEASYLEEIKHSNLEVLDYRIVTGAEDYPLLGISQSLTGFQNSLTAVFDAMKNGPKEKAKYSRQVRLESALEFGYFYPGSKGFRLFARADSDLFGSNFKRTSDALMDYLEIKSSAEAIDASRSLGLAAITELFKWVDTNSKWNQAIDYQWSIPDVRVSGRYVTGDDFGFLKELFQGAEDKEVSDVRESGILVGIDIIARTFHFSVPNGDTFKGRLSDEFTDEASIVPSRYIADIKETTVRKPATGKTVTSYLLRALIEDG